MFWMVCGVALSGCATLKTLDDTRLPLNQRIFIYSGSRLDWAALTENQAALRKFSVEPPDYPLIDLPLSFGLDTLFLPLTLWTEIFH
ncbi:YceK/YidQ family lipoprotein [Methylomonas sp. MgM2]